MARMGWMAMVLAAGAVPAIAKDAPPQVLVFKNVLDCRGVADAAARLACFDTTVGAFGNAERKKEVIVVDKVTMREARRGLFGFSLPSIRLFSDGNGSGAPETIESIDAKITTVGLRLEGGWLLTIDNGSRWEQIDSEYINRPREGQQVNIRRATLSGYIAKVEKGRAFRVRRLVE